MEWIVIPDAGRFDDLFKYKNSIDTWIDYHHRNILLDCPDDKVWVALVGQAYDGRGTAIGRILNTISDFEELSELEVERNLWVRVYWIDKDLVDSWRIKA